MLYKKIISVLLLAFIVFGVCACGKTGNEMLNDEDTKAEEDAAADFIELNDVFYGDDMLHKLDIVMPDKNANGGVIVMIHGGAWTDGGKGEMNKYRYDFYKKGFTYAQIDYRFAKNGLAMGDLLDDVTLALAGIKQTAAENGIELENAMLGGISAGGQMALLYSYSHREEAPLSVKCCVGMSAVSDMTARSVWINNPLDEYQSAKNKMVKIGSRLCGFDFDESSFDDALPCLEKISPLAYAENAVPTILAHGVADDIIPYDIAVSMYNALNANGIECSFVSFTNSGHTLESDPLCKIQLNKQMLDFADRYLK